MEVGLNVLAIQGVKVDMNHPLTTEDLPTKNHEKAHQVQAPRLASHLKLALGHVVQHLRTIHTNEKKPLQERIATLDQNDPERQTLPMKELALYQYCQPRFKEKQISFSLLIALLNQAVLEREPIVKPH